jgi:hypothetical protein
LRLCLGCNDPDEGSINQGHVLSSTHHIILQPHQAGFGGSC